MKRIFGLLIVVLLGFSVQAQNMIVNGTDFQDSDMDGIADSWFVGNRVTSANVDDESQYAYSDDSQVIIFQYVEAYNTVPKKYRIEFDLECNEETDVSVGYTDIMSLQILSIPAGTIGMNHYSAIFDQSLLGIWNINDLEFCSQGTENRWIRIRNVSMVEMKTIGLEQCPDLNDPWEGGDNPTQNLIQNGTMDGVGSLAQPWQINEISTPTLENGIQRVDSPFAAELFQSINLEIGNYILNFDLQSNYYAQVAIYSDSVNGWVASINPIPFGEMTHYSIAFSVYDTCIMIKWRTIPNYATWLKLDNVTLIQSFAVGIEEKHLQTNVKDGYYSFTGQKLTGPVGSAYIHIKQGIRVFP